MTKWLMRFCALDS